ncbi:NADH-quinone oxidoreductase subunit M [Thioalkalivibrio sp. HK1]|uniref:NADH-quinone oxidoreductase subunit M n=1 Tax=Thioalkalivibrio sp. HK1 TaxID=1469245 RepID=UPI00046EB6B3|nr:NADH-quinone oxidoreductase subunit M [Thioalkalivibrio sp. HK1]
MIVNIPLLSLLIWAPIAGGAWILISGRRDRNRPDRDDSARLLALVVSLIVFILSIWMWAAFDREVATVQFVERAAWLPAFDINYHLGVDGISVPLIVLTTLMTVLVIIAGWGIGTKQSQYMAAFLIQQGLMIGAFSALDSILFYFFWEALLIPMFLIIGIWGGPRRIYATIKFFLYTFFGSVLMLIAFLYLHSQSGSFAILDLYGLRLGMQEQVLIFIAFLIAFAVKVPMWPVHTWLPDAHVEAPTGGSVILASIMLKLGGYGFLRFSLPMVPDAAAALASTMIVLSLIAIVYIGFVALVQPDMKKLIAYSSVSHMGFVTLGIFVAFPILLSDPLDHTTASLGIQGAMVQMISHGFISGALFLCIGVLYDRLHSRMISDYGGVAHRMPVFAALAMVFAMANSGVPGTSGFAGEFMVILASFKAGAWIAFLAAMTLILGAAYTLWMYKRVIYGPVANENVQSLTGSTLRENSVLLVLALLVIVLGVWPAPLLETMGPSVDLLIETISQSKIRT